ncbi:MAG: sigma-54-dependent Fis family transcriptional regulator [Bacteroidales bacterium]|nr:sigma-54-dependent Fis family transcriptional regulator [Bacteroidales bacterium]
MKTSILIIDDDPFIVNLLENYFKKEGYQIFTSSRGKPALKILNAERIDVVLCDIRLPDINGTELLLFIRQGSPDTMVIMMTAYAEIRAAVESIKAGAFDYVTKPIQPEEISNTIRRAIKVKVSNQVATEDVFITGESTKMLEVIDQARLVAPTDMSVLIQGETGSGKEYIARLIHQNSSRKNKKFMAIDCGAIPRELAASELFGHIKGSFTGAISDKSGYFEQANGGTIFLDEIGNLTYETQVKLLRAIQHKVITRVGDSKTIDVDVRIISASNSDLLKASGNGNFREDLYHRINEFKLELPPLRKRGDDILIFANHFIKEANRDLKKEVTGFDDEVATVFKKYSWYGNLRELRNVVKRSVLVTRNSVVDLSCLPLELSTHQEESDHTDESNDAYLDLKDATEKAEKLVVERALKEANYNKSEAAKLLNIDRKTLYNKLRRFGIEL